MSRSLYKSVCRCFLISRLKWLRRSTDEPGQPGSSVWAQQWVSKPQGLDFRKTNFRKISEPINEGEKLWHQWRWVLSEGIVEAIPLTTSNYSDWLDQSIKGLVFNEVLMQVLSYCGVKTSTPQKQYSFRRSQWLITGYLLTSQQNSNNINNFKYQNLRVYTQIMLIYLFMVFLLQFKISVKGQASMCSPDSIFKNKRWFMNKLNSLHSINMGVML